MKKLLFLAVAVALIAGCSAPGITPNGYSLCDPTISEVGPSTFYGEDSCGGSYALRGAVTFCGDRNQRMMLTNKMDDYIIFQCLDQSDSRYVRPEFKTAPDVRIEDSRKQ
jgi:hypothetical protein